MRHVNPLGVISGSFRRDVRAETIESKTQLHLRLFWDLAKAVLVGHAQKLP